jgi:hypothetical protein
MMANIAEGFQSLLTEYQKIVRLAQYRYQIVITPVLATSHIRSKIGEETQLI